MARPELQALPVSGRRWQDFVLDNTPTSTTPAAGQGQISLRGAGEPAEIAVDGVGRGLAFGRLVDRGKARLGGDRWGKTGKDRREWRKSGLEAMPCRKRGGDPHGWRRRPATWRPRQTGQRGGRMNVETQSGANEMHGQGFLFDRQSAWGAQNPFTQWVKETAPATETTVPVFTPETIPLRTVKRPGASAWAGRIRRNKLFWFAALDSYNRNDPGLATVKIPSVFFAQPTNDQMQVLSARLGLSSANPVAEGLAAYSGLLETLDGLLGPRSADSNAMDRLRAARLAGGRAASLHAGGHRRTMERAGRRLTRFQKPTATTALGQARRARSGCWAAGGFCHPQPSGCDQASAGRAIQEARPETPSIYEPELSCRECVGASLPEIVVDNRYGFTIGNPSRFGQGSYPDEHLYHGQESVDWVRGKLLVKAGFEASHNADCDEPAAQARPGPTTTRT